MRPKSYTYTVAANNDDSVFENQQPSGAGNFTLNGANVSGGEWVTPDNLARQIVFTHAADDSGVTMTITGYLDLNKHIAVTETVTGGNATTAFSTEFFSVITSISISGAAAGNIKAGFTAPAGGTGCVAKSQLIPLNVRAGTVTMQLEVSGTITNADVNIESTNNIVERISETTIFTEGDLEAVNNTLNSTVIAKRGSFAAVPSCARIDLRDYDAAAVVKLSLSQSDV